MKRKRSINKLLTVCLIVFVILPVQQKAIAAAPGALDPSFGTAGIVKTNILGNDFMTDITTQPDGKVIAVGGCDVGDFTIVRYLANGDLDTTFSSDGIAFIDFGSTNEAAVAVRVQLDGKIVVVGFTSTNNGAARLNPNGSLDTTFGTDGKVLVGFGLGRGGLEFQPDGKIVIGGGTVTSFVIARLNPNGSFDTTFGTNGTVSTNLPSQADFEEMRIQTNGRIVAVGHVASSSMSVVVRYFPNGALDGSFSGDGIAINDFSTANETVSSLVIDPISDTITTVGTNSAGSRSMLIVRYLSNGNLDTSFSGDGILEVNGPMRRGVGVVQQSDRKFVFSGDDGGLGSVRLARVNLNGTIDTGFGINGFVNLNNNGTGSRKLLSLLGDKLVIGNSANSTADFGIERVNLTSTPTSDRDFTGDGSADVAVFRPSTGFWFILRSEDFSFFAFPFGENGDIPAPADFDGDGKMDVAVFRPSSATWFIARSGGGNLITQFGVSSDLPSPADYDGDGIADIAIFRPNGHEWWVARSTGGLFATPFGTSGDIPIR